jgi:sporulation protein YlmC with PRC-barrel domain
MTGAFCFAEDKATGKVQMGDNTVKGEVRTDMDKGDMHAMGQHYRVSKFMKKDVHDSAGKDIGDIKDVVLDGNANRVSYVVVSYGGFMGMGNKLFAIPLGAFEFRQDGDKKDEYKVHMTIAEDNLKNAPGFDEKQWPDMADSSFRTSVDDYYTKHGMKAHGEMDKKDMGGDKAQGPTDRKGLTWTRRASKAIGADVHNKADEELGEISDLVFDTRSGKIHYAVLSFGGVMGIGDKLFAVPMESLASKHDDNKFVMDASKDQLKNAPGFNKDAWPDFASADFRKGVDDYYRTDRKDTTVKTPME